MKILLLLLSLLLTASCSIEKQRGFQFKEIEKVRNFSKYNFTKKDVLNNIGKPLAELEENTWLYYSYVYKNPKMLKNKLNNETILIVYFNAKGNVKNHIFVERGFKGKISNIKGSEEKEKNKLLNEIFNDITVSPVN